MRARSEQPAVYVLPQVAADDEIITQALAILAKRTRRGDVLSSPAAVHGYLQLSIGGREHEVFGCVWLNAQNGVIEIEEIFRGTLTQTSCYPREIVKGALKVNAAGVIFFHNHPSGIAEPSHADQTLTQSLKAALAMVDVKVVDHFIVAGGDFLSFAERGLL